MNRIEGAADLQGQPLRQHGDSKELTGWPRTATATLYLVDGMTFGAWAAAIPSFQHRFGLTAGELSGVLASLVVGCMLTMPLAGRWITAFGSRRVAVTAGMIFSASLVGVALAPNYVLLLLAAAVLGACKGSMDVSINAQGITVENAVGKPIMSLLNGFWSFGGLLSASLLSIALHAGFTAPSLLIGLALPLAGLTFSVRRQLLPDTATKTDEAKPVGRQGWSLPNRRLLGLGLLGFLALFSEGVLLDWSAVYARTVAHFSTVAAPWAFGVFSVCMAVGRFGGDSLRGRLGAAWTMRLSGGLMILGMLMAVAIPRPSLVLAGFAVTGLGIANLVPLVFSAAGRSHEAGAGPGLALVATIGYTGFLAGPPIIGLLAAFFGLPLACSTVVLFGLIVATLGAAIVRSVEERETKTGPAARHGADDERMEPPHAWTRTGNARTMQKTSVV